MKGNPKVISVLSEVLKAELTAINQYFLHAEMCENWGYQKLAKHTRAESIEEMQHAEKLIEHILYLDGTPNMSDYFKINMGQNVKAQLEFDLQVEYEAVKRLNEGIEVCVKAGDNGLALSSERYSRRRGSSTSTGWKGSCMPSVKWVWRITWRNSCTRTKKSSRQEQRGDSRSRLSWRAQRGFSAVVPHLLVLFQ